MREKRATQATAAAIVVAGATVVALVLAGTWSAARSDIYDGAIWRSAVLGAATVTALAAAGLLAAWWRSQSVAPALWWSLAMAAIGAYCALGFAAVLAEPGVLPSSVKAVSASLIGLAGASTIGAVTSAQIDLTARSARVVPAAAGASALAGVAWWITRTDWFIILGWLVIAAIALAYGLRERDNLAGWFAVGVLGVLHYDVLGLDSSPDAIVAVSSGLVLELGLILMLLGTFHQVEQGHAALERRLRAADARLHLLKVARKTSFNESEHRHHEARSALAALDHATRLMPAFAGSLPLRDMIHSEVALLRRLVTPGLAKPRPFLVADALVGTVAVERLYGVNVRVRVPSHLTVFGDLSATAEATQCLLENARIHAPGSAIDVAASRVGDEVHISIADTGPGLSARDAEQLFERGFTTGPGTGLGLGIAKTIMERQGGRLWWDEEAVAGTRFVIALPVFSAGAHPSHQLDDLGQTADGGGTALVTPPHDAGAFARLVEDDGDAGI